MIGEGLQHVDVDEVDAELFARDAVTLHFFLGRIDEAVRETGAVLLITADHGNSELMRDKNDKPHTQHTTNLVPFIICNADASYAIREGGALADIAPTVLELMQLEQPESMTGASLIQRTASDARARA